MFVFLLTRLIFAGSEEGDLYNIFISAEMVYV